MEYLATKAERDSIKYMQIRFMQDHIDDEFKGVISGVTDWGIYVEIISNKCEGMVSVRDMTDDRYDFDEGAYALVGRSAGKIYQLGEEVIVKVKNTDLIKKHLDFFVPRGGFFLWLRLKKHSAKDLQKVALNKGLIFPHGSVFFVEDVFHDDYIRLAFSKNSTDELHRGGIILSKCLTA